MRTWGFRMRRLKPARGGRVVTIMEISGYTFLSILLTFVIYAYFKRLPVIAGAQGTAAPTFSSVTAAADTAVLSVRAKDGQEVKKGQPILEVTDDPVEVGVLRVQAALQARSQEDPGNPGDARYDQWAAVLTSGEFKIVRGKVLTGPRDGWLIYAKRKPPSGWLPKEATLFSVADFRSLTVVAKIPKDQGAKRLKIGQTAKVWFNQLGKKPVMGKLVKLEPGGPDLPEGQIATVEASLMNLPAGARARARQDFFNGKMTGKWRPAVGIIIGRERLVNQIRKPSKSD